MTFDVFKWRRCACGVALIIFAPWALAGDCDRSSAVATLESVQGLVSVNQSTAETEHVLCAGDTIRVGPFSRAAVRLLATSTTVRIDQETQLQIPAAPAENRSVLDLLKGVIYLFSREPRSIDVNTVYANAAVEGTEFLVSVNDERSQVTVLEGTVVTSNAQGQVTAVANQSVVAFADQAPRLVKTVKPEDAVQWALYYQPVLAALVVPSEGGQRLLPADYRTTADATHALEQLAQVPAAERDENYHVVRAGLLLAVGQADSARQDLEKALALNSSSSDAKSLLAMLAVARNERESALALATEAVADDAQSPAARLALSYAEQARFELDAALASTRSAVDLDPDNALAWARLSELLLSFGNTEEALQAAQQAADLNDKVARTQTVLGFAHLAEIDTAAAKQAFERAIALDQAAPLPRLGLGLALIREGELELGREKIEVAVSLDPNNALLRSYLGKVYFEQTAEDLAAAQFDLAKALDPLDPTPHYYEAIALSTENDPASALRALDRSIELNDNRAVYRSRLLIDSDLAARTTSLARVYTELGFHQLAIAEAAKSLAADPTNSSAYRFLADSWAKLPRHDTARVSALLKSQLLQGASLTPQRTAAFDGNLAILAQSGPTNLSFNEYTPLFVRNGATAAVQGTVGSNDTFAEDIALTGNANSLSYALGQFHYETDGFRDNADLEHDIYRAFLQYDFSPQSSAQIEWLSRDTENGDLTFSLGDFSGTTRREFESDMVRVGYRFQPDPANLVLFSLVKQDFQEINTRTQVFSPGTFFDERIQTDLDGTIAEAQYIHLGSVFGMPAAWTLGVGTTSIDSEVAQSLNTVIDGELFPDPPEVEGADISYENAYTYLNLSPSSAATLTLGVSYDDFYREARKRIRQVNPKLGLVWTPSFSTTVRFAALRSLKRPLTSTGRTLEPVQLAGFNQVFDDITGSDVDRVALGLDRRLSKDLSVGLEASRRNIELPRPFQRKQREDSLGAYSYWTVSPRVAITAAYRFERFLQNSAPLDEPTSIDTHFVPLTISGFLPNRIFSSLTATYVNQDAVFPGSSTVPSETKETDFVVVDAELGYLLPQRSGRVSLKVHNLFDEDFSYQDRNFQLTEPQTPGFYPERIISANFSLVF